jgi:hypothetical protein
MKRFIAVLLTLVLAASLSACSKDSFMDLSAFTDYYNRISSEDISLESYAVTEGEYSLVLDGMLLTLERAQSGDIEGVRLTAAKVNEKGEKKPVSDEEASRFSLTATDILEAYTTLSRQDCEKIIADLGLSSSDTFNGEGELTLTRGDWLIIYYSVEIGSVFMVYNIHLHPTEKTEKPESKPFFGHTAYTREEGQKLY